MCSRLDNHEPMFINHTRHGENLKDRIAALFHHKFFHIQNLVLKIAGAL